MTRRPTAPELVEAVREHLALLIPTLTDPRWRFQTLVAVHVLGVVSRELAAQPPAVGTTEGWSAQEQAAMASLPGSPASDADLCAAIRAGALDDGTSLATLLDVLRARVETDVSLWNPSFLARVRGG